MAGRGKGGRVAKEMLMQTLQRLKLEEEQKAREQQQAAADKKAEDTSSASDSESVSRVSQTGSDQPSERQSQASETSASESESGASSPGSPSPRAVSPTPVHTLGGRGKLRKYLIKKTPPDTPRSQSPDLSSETPSTQSGTDTGTDTGTETGESSPASGRSQSPAPSPEPTNVPSALKPIENKVIGKDGELFKVAVNFMKINVKPKKSIHLYAVFFEPNVDAIYLRRKILHSPEVYERTGSIMNFTGTNLFLPGRLEEDPCIIQVPHPTSPETCVEVTIQHVKIPPTEELVMFYNNLFNKVLRAMKLVELNFHHYNPVAKIDVSAHKLEVWPGYVCAIQDYDGGLMLNCDTSHRVLRKTTARDMLHDIFQNDGANFMDRAIKLLVGAIVLTRYNNKAYRIDDIDFKRNPMSKFTMKEGQEITFVDYFRQHWGVEIKDLKQPLLLHRPKQRRGATEEPPLICLIPELSYLTGLTDDIRSDHRAMKDLATHTKISPEIKHRRLADFIRQAYANADSKKVLDDWGVEIDTRPYETTARKFPPEKMTFGNGVEFTLGDKADWGMKLRDASILESKDVRRWYFIYNARDKSKADEFVKNIQMISRKLGFIFDNPRRIELRDDSTNTYRKTLKEVDRGAELIVIMTPGSSQREDRYAIIKQACCVDLGIPSQVVRVSTLSPNKLKAVVQNIAMQIACKQGGQLWSINIPLPSAMIVGLDSYHDPSNKARSVVGIVSSMNKLATKWYSRCFFQNRREEIVNTLGAAMTAALKKYTEVNGSIPSKIFIYRDGVGDGDLPMVRDYEIPQIDESISNFIKSKPDLKKPQLSFIVVQKRVNVKLMSLAGRNINNPPPGSVIDHTVTRRQFYDFYLVSQHVHQGTVTPTHYISLLDECGLGPDKMQKLSYKMTHLYYNFPATIRVPAPCQYAHKLAFLMGQYVKTQPNDALIDKLYYL